MKTLSISRRVTRLAQRLDATGHPELADDLDALLAPRTIPMHEVPDDPGDPFWTGRQRMYHATNALNTLYDQGLRSRDEQGRMGKEVRQGLGGGWDERVSLTPYRQTAETISNRMRDIVEIVNSPTPEDGFEKANEIGARMAEMMGLDPQEVLSQAWEMQKGKIHDAGGSEWPDKMTRAKLTGYKIITPHPHERPTLDEPLPPGAILKNTTKNFSYIPPQYDDGIERVAEYWVPIDMDDDEFDKWGYEVIHYYDLILRVIENMGGPPRPGFWGTSGRHVRGLSPEDIGFVQVVAEGEPERVHGDVLDEYEWDPRRTRVVV